MSMKTSSYCMTADSREPLTDMEFQDIVDAINELNYEEQRSLDAIQALATEFAVKRDTHNVAIKSLRTSNLQLRQRLLFSPRIPATAA